MCANTVLHWPVDIIHFSAGPATLQAEPYMTRPAMVAGRKFHDCPVHLPFEVPAGSGWFSSAVLIWCQACRASSTEPSSSMVVMSPGFFSWVRSEEHTSELQ